MDYIVNVDGVDILIEGNETSKNRDLLLKYYSNLLMANGANISNEKQKALEQVVENMTDQAAQGKIAVLGAERVNIIASYAEKIQALTAEEKDTADALLEVLDVAMEDVKQECKMINGNKFVFQKGTVDIELYCKKLYNIGQETKGNTWTLYIDEEGELVIY